MSTDKNHSEQFERYLKGQMSPKEAHAFERKVLDDPFALEALEGFEEQGANTLNDLEHLRSQIRDEEKKTWTWMWVAAVIALLIVGSFTIYYFTDQIEGEQLAMKKEPAEDLTQSDPEPDSISINSKTVREETQKDTFEKDGLKVKDKDEEVVENYLDETDPEITDKELNTKSDNKLKRLAEASNSEGISQLAGEKKGVQLADAEALEKVMVESEKTDMIVMQEEVISEQAFIAKKEIAVTENTNKGAVARSATRSSDLETISGIVTDDAGEPLPGVNVVIKGTVRGVTTDVNGKYQLPKTENMTLIYSYVGFQTQEIAVEDRSTIDVSMDGAMALQEVVVTGNSFENDVSSSSAKPVIGNQAYKKYLKENLKYPTAAKNNQIEGEVVLQVTINAAGEIEQVDIKKSLGYGCDQEAIRLIKEGPEWESAIKNGQAVSDSIEVEIAFKN